MQTPRKRRRRLGSKLPAKRVLRGGRLSNLRTGRGPDFFKVPAKPACNRFFFFALLPPSFSKFVFFFLFPHRRRAKKKGGSVSASIRRAVSASGYSRGHQFGGVEMAVFQVGGTKSVPTLREESTDSDDSLSTLECKRLENGRVPHGPECLRKSSKLL